MYTRPSFIGTYNIRKGFLDRDSLFSTQFSSDFDEPTYLSFKLNFYSDERLTDEMTYDTLPQALFTPPNLPDGNPYDRWMDWASDDELREIIADYQYDLNRSCTTASIVPSTISLTATKTSVRFSLLNSSRVGQNYRNSTNSIFNQCQDWTNSLNRILQEVRNFPKTLL